MSDRTEQLKELLARELDIDMADITPESKLKELGTDLDFDVAITNIEQSSISLSRTKSLMGLSLYKTSLTMSQNTQNNFSHVSIS
ncbi:hypothetical protein SAMN05444064_11413 [Pseudomonas syringae]|uniref:hypothetical protein n=1 Tax=Pseudomonas syringae TaxID=317 RepID=UPI00089BEC3E|nr:hypothetical protein [Pseudomonas syringae]SDX15552.1 hypothetical protein SAMN05444514_11313 [Pseudomonas syringae]SFM32068.1 hypothetical protein SAMN05444064_11413 [Pseudomonas syringae]